MVKNLRIGDRVEGGESETEDYDRGRVTFVDRKSKTGTVCWDSGTITQVTFDSVAVIGPRGPRGSYLDRDED